MRRDAPTALGSELLVSVPEAGRRLGISRSTALELVASGRLGSVKVGARRLVPVAELERFVADLCDATHIEQRRTRCASPLRPVATGAGPSQ